MAESDFGINRIVSAITAISKKQIAIEPSNHVVIGVPVFGYKDNIGDGTPHYCLVLDANGRVVDFEVTGDFTWAGLSDYFNKTSDTLDDISEGTTNKQLTTTLVSQIADSFKKSTDTINDIESGALTTILNSKLASVSHGKTLTGLGTTVSPLDSAPSFSLVAGESFAKTDGAIVGSTSAIGEYQRVLRENRAMTALSGGAAGPGCADDKYIYFRDTRTTPNYVSRLDRITLKNVKTYNGFTATYDPYNCHPDGGIIIIQDSQFVWIRESMLSHTTHARTNGDVRAGASRVIGRHLYFINVSDVLTIINLDDWSDVYSGALAGITNEVSAIDVDADEKYLYLLDANSTGSTTGYVRRVDLALATPAVDLSSGSYSATAEYRSFLRIHDGFLYTGIESSGLKIVVRNLSTLAVAYTDTAPIAAYATYPARGILYASTSNTTVAIKEYQLPSLTSKAKGAAEWDLNGGEITIDGKTITPQQWMDGIVNARITMEAVGGVSVASVETSLPVSPVTGSWYLITPTGGVSYLAYRLPGSWVTMAPYEGAEVFDKTNRWTWVHQAGSWVPKLDLVFTGTTAVSNTDETVTTSLRLNPSDTTKLAKMPSNYGTPVEITLSAVFAARYAVLKGYAFWSPEGITEVPDWTVILSNFAGELTIDTTPGVYVVTPNFGLDIRVSHTTASWVGVESDIKWSARVIGNPITPCPTVVC